MLHSRCSNRDVASSKGRMNASTNEMIGRPALKSFFRLGSAYASRALGWRRKAHSPRVSTLKGSFGCFLDLVQLSFKILCLLLKHVLVAHPTWYGIARDSSTPQHGVGGLHNAKWLLQFCSSHCPQFDCGTYNWRPPFGHAATTSLETPPRGCREDPAGGWSRTKIPTLHGIAPTLGLFRGNKCPRCFR